MLSYDTTRILRGEEGYVLPGRRGFECGVGSRQEPHYQCSRPPEHNGRHAAHTDTGIQVASWENRPGVTR